MMSTDPPDDETMHLNMGSTCKTDSDILNLNPDPLEAQNHKMTEGFR